MSGICFPLQQMRNTGVWTLRILCAFLSVALCQAQDDQPDLTQMTLEQLSKVEVTSASKKEQKLTDTAAAVYVITQQDIHNSPATSIPELLKIVPGLQVARLSNGRWAISARGFAEQYVEEMLVLIDGRSVFDPLFSGVFWNEQDIMLEDIERIEVIRGPGATMWGANAFNGIINIITKSAKATQGTLITAGVGDGGRPLGAVRYGGSLGQSTSYRIYSKYSDEGPPEGFTGPSGDDASRSLSGGFRLDSKFSHADSLLLEGKIYTGRLDFDNQRVIFAPPFSLNYLDFLQDEREDLLARWTHKSLNGSETTFQASYGHLLHDQTGVTVNGNVTDLSLQHEAMIGQRHDLTTGVEYEYKDATTSSAPAFVAWNPSNPWVQLASVFIQDEMLFANGAVHFTSGLRLDHSSLSGFALEPNVRLLWKVTSRHSLWTAYSLANRTTSPTDAGLMIDVAAFPSPPGLDVVRFFGNPALKSEKVNSFEMGYRVQASKKLSFDITTFYNYYYDVIGSVPGQPFLQAGPPLRLVLPTLEQNNISGGTLGGEFVAKWVPTSNLRFVAGYALTELDLAQSALTNAATLLNGSTPRHQVNLSSSANLTRKLTLDSTLLFSDARPAQNIPGYTTVDSAVVWRPFQATEFKFGAENLFNKQHLEFISQQGGLSSLEGRRAYAKVTWHF